MLDKLKRIGDRSGVWLPKRIKAVDGCLVDLAFDTDGTYTVYLDPPHARDRWCTSIKFWTDLDPLEAQCLVYELKAKGRSFLDAPM